MSKGLRKGLIALLLIAVLAYIGAKLFVRSQADAALKEASYALRDVVTLSYEGFSAGLDGSVTLNKLTIRPSEGEGELFVRRLTVAADSLPAALGVRRHLSAGRLPSHLRLEAEDLRLNFDSPLYRQLREWSAGFIVGTPMDLLACGDTTADAKTLEAMGYSYIRADASAEFTRGRDDRAALITARVDAEDLARISGEAVLRIKEGALNLDTLSSGTAALAEADLVYRDSGYFDARNYYCAAQRDSDVEAFLAAHRQAVAAYLRQRGIVATDAFLDAYVRLIGSTGNELHVGLSPGKQLPINKLAGMPLEQLNESLQPNWSVNGNAIEQAVARWVAPGNAAPDAEAGDGRTGEARYYPADPGVLDQLVGSFARIVTYDGTTHKGIILEASGSRITMQRRFQGGDMSFGVRIGDVKSVEIYRRQPLPASLEPKPEPEEEPETVVVSPEVEDAGPAAAESDTGAPTEGEDATSEEGSSPRQDAERAGAMTSPDPDDLDPRPPGDDAEEADTGEDGASDP